MSTTDKIRNRVQAWREDRSGSGSVRARLQALEDEVQELRQLNRRIAELTDVVAELLVPLQSQDQDRVREVLERYRASI